MQQLLNVIQTILVMQETLANQILQCIMMISHLVISDFVNKQPVVFSVQQSHKQLLTVKIQMPVAVNDVQLLVIEKIFVISTVDDTGEDILKVGDIIWDIIGIHSLAGSVRIMLGHVRQIVIDKASLLLGRGPDILVPGRFSS